MANLFRSRDGRLDMAYLRTCAVYKLFTSHQITEARAIELLAERRVPSSVISFWRKYRDAMGPVRECLEKTT